ncbi:MAG: ferrous iron transport protein B [Anaerolineae bacterium]|nr:ferrous iron transport protein B [Anaerolineae bacterium]
MAEEELREVSIALAGQPNVGKSTVFNMLTGLNQHVGNWPGKTVERRTGTFVHDNVRVHIIDLPGTYCLTAASPEERIARDYIIRERPDVVIAILNAASLERNLYLVAELLALPVPIVIGLNMMDVAQQEGFEIEPAVLAAAIGVPVVPMVASRNEGVHELIDAALDVALHGLKGEPHRPEIRQDHRELLDRLLELIREHVPSPYPPDWVALKMLEGDQEITALMREVLPPEVWATVDGMLRKHEDAIIAVASGRYEWIRRMTRAALKRPRAGNITLTQRLDNVATHPFWGLVVLGIVLGVIFTLTYKIGGVLQEWLATYLVDKLAEAVQGALAGAPAWLSGLLVNGIIGGVGTVITFLPILAVFFAVMGLMEDIGYMARAAYVVDRFMHAIGLHGKSFMPLFLGFGCNVPAIMGARIIESERSRLLTILLAPLVPCTARLAVLAVLVPIFFPQQATIVSWALTALPLVVLALTGVTINKLILKGERSAFIMEMPLYHVPNWRTIGILVWQRLVAFLRKAGTIILLMSVLIWALSTLPTGEIEESYLAALGRFLAPLGAPMGLGWRPLVALLTSFVAKENAVATLGVLYGVGENSQALAQVLSSQFASASALAFLVAEMLFIPCVSTLAVIKQEAGSWKWVLIDVGFLAVLTLLAGTIAYQLGALLL